MMNNLFPGKAAYFLMRNNTHRMRLLALLISTVAISVANTVYASSTELDIALETARDYKKSSHYEKAIFEGKRALILARTENENICEAAALLLLGEIYILSGNNPLGKKNLLESLKVREKIFPVSSDEVEEVLIALFYGASTLFERKYLPLSDRILFGEKLIAAKINRIKDGGFTGNELENEQLNLIGYARDLAEVYQLAGNLGKAERWANFSVLLHDRVLPYRKGDPFGARQVSINYIGKNVLSKIYEEQKKYDLAGELYFDVYKKCIDLHDGIENEYCLNEMHNLGVFLVKVGKYDAAEKLLHSGFVISHDRGSYKRHVFANSLKELYSITNRPEKFEVLEIFHN